MVYPERDMAQRTAVRYSAHNAYDYIELTSEYAIFELRVPAAWVGKTIREVDVRAHHNINIIGYKEGGAYCSHYRPSPCLHRAGASARGRGQEGSAASDG